MAEKTTKESEVTETVIEDDKPDKPPPKPTETVDFWKAQARENEKRAKANAEAAQKLQEIEDSQRSESERLTEQLNAVTKEREAATVERDRMSVALSKGLTASQAKRLVGANVEEFEADADELLADLTAPDKPPEDDLSTLMGRPKERLKPGTSDPNTPTEETDVKLLGARMFNH